MIEIKNVSKTFSDVKAVDNITLTIKENMVMGLLGTNGAGKSTLLRMIAGILKPDEGEILIDELPVWDNPEAKSLFFYISDDQYYFPNSTPIFFTPKSYAASITSLNSKSIFITPFEIW